jgi:hypothetical protein
MQNESVIKEIKDLYLGIYSEFEKLDELLQLFDFLEMKWPEHNVNQLSTEWMKKVGYDKDFFEFMENENYEKYYRPLINNIFVILCISTFEKSIDQVCSFIQKRKSLPIKRKDLQGNLFRTSQKYLSVLGKIKNFDSKLWELADWIYSLRNVLTHKGREITKSEVNSNNAICRLLEKKVGIGIQYFFDPFEPPPVELKKTSPKECEEIKDKGKIIINREFCNFCVETFTKLFKNLENLHIKSFQKITLIK